MSLYFTSFMWRIPFLHNLEAWVISSQGITELEIKLLKTPLANFFVT